MRDPRTIDEAREFLREHMDDGVKCPCCTQLVKIYHRKILASMAAPLIEMYRRFGLTWVHVAREIQLPGGDFWKLRFWGLIEREPSEDSERSARWRITQMGEDYIVGLLAVPKYVHLFDDKPLRQSGPSLTIYDALGTRFDYHELMAGV